MLRSESPGHLLCEQGHHRPCNQFMAVRCIDDRWSMVMHRPGAAVSSPNKHRQVFGKAAWAPLAYQSPPPPKRLGRLGQETVP